MAENEGRWSALFPETSILRLTEKWGQKNETTFVFRRQVAKDNELTFSVSIFLSAI